MLPFIQPKGGVDLAGATLGLDYGTTADYYVDQATGDDGNAGTSTGAAFETLGAAITAAQGDAGAVIAVRAGTYRELVDLGSTNYTNGLTIQPYGTETPTISAAEVLTGWTQCTSAETLLGENWSNCYYVDIDLTGVIGASWALGCFNLYVNGVIAPIAHDSNIDLDPVFLLDDEAYYTGTFTGNPVTSIADADVINSDRYTDAQLENARVLLYGGNNVSKYCDISASDVASNTITISDGQAPVSSRNRYAIVNAANFIQAGHWAYNATPITGSTYRVYYWPNDVSELTAGVEYSRRTRCIYINQAQGAITIQGLTLLQPAGIGGARHGTCISTLTGAASGTRKSSITIRNCEMGRSFSNDFSGSIGGGAVHIQNYDDIIIENNTIYNCANTWAVYLFSTSDVKVTKNKFDKCSQAAVRLFGGGTPSGIFSERIEISFNDVYDCARDTHANLMNAYEGCDYVLLYGNRFRECQGYLTWQESSNLFIGMNWIEMDKFNDLSGETGRCIVDQTNTSGEPDESDAVCYIWNNALLPRPGEEADYTNSLSLGTANGPMVFEVYNNIIHGGGVPDALSSLNQAQEGNLYTAYTDAWSQDGTDLNASETYDNVMGDTYQNSAVGDFKYTWGGNAGLAGVAITSLVAVAKATWPSFNFEQDMFGHPFDPRRPFIGPKNPKFRS